MLLTFLAMAGVGVALLQTAVGRQALVDQWEGTALAFGREVDDREYTELRALSAYGPAYAVARAVVEGPVLTVVVAGLIASVFNATFGRRATYRQALAVVAHAGVLLALRHVIAAPFQYAGETLASPASLGRWVPGLDAASLPARFFGAVDLFVVWWVVALALGTAQLYGRAAGGLIVAFMGAYLALAGAMALAMAAAGGIV